MTLEEQIEAELKHMGLKLTSLQGRLPKHHDFLFELRVIFVKHFYIKGYTRQQIADVFKIHISTVNDAKHTHIKPIKEKDIIINKHYSNSQNIRRMKRYLKIEHYGN